MNPTLIAVCTPSPSSAAFRREPAEVMAKAVNLARRCEEAIHAALGADQPPKLPKNEDWLASINDRLRVERFAFCLAVMAEGVRRAKAEGGDLTEDVLAQIVQIAVAGLEVAGLAYRTPEHKPVSKPAPERIYTPEEAEQRAQELADLRREAEALVANPPRQREVQDNTARFLAADMERAAVAKAAAEADKT